MRRPAYYRAHQGQALTELLIIALALIPLFLIVPLIAKYQDISHSTQIASRYAAFAAATRGRTLNTTDRSQYLADNIRRRIFSNTDAPVKTNDVPGNFKANQNLFWRTPQDHSLIQDFGDVQLSFGVPAGMDHNHAFIDASDDKPFNQIGKDDLNLPAQGVYTVNVSVKLANMPSGLKFYEPFDKINLTMTRSTSLLLDPWTAWSPTNAEKHFENPTIFPAKALADVSQGLEPLVRVIDSPGNIPAPQLGKLDFWRDVVPEDRLRSQ